MKKKLLLILTLGIVLMLTACRASETETATFQATVLEVYDSYCLVEPAKGSTELNSADKITVPMDNVNLSSELEAGDVLEIEYDGQIAESYPAQIINVYSIRIIE